MTLLVLCLGLLLIGNGDALTVYRIGGLPADEAGVEVAPKLIECANSYLSAGETGRVIGPSRCNLVWGHGNVWRCLG